MKLFSATYKKLYFKNQHFKQLIHSLLFYKLDIKNNSIKLHKLDYYFTRNNFKKVFFFFVKQPNRFKTSYSIFFS